MFPTTTFNENQKRSRDLVHVVVETGEHEFDSLPPTKKRVKIHKKNVDPCIFTRMNCVFPTTDIVAAFTVAAEKQKRSNDDDNNGVVNPPSPLAPRSSSAPPIDDDNNGVVNPPSPLAPRSSSAPPIVVTTTTTSSSSDNGKLS